MKLIEEVRKEIPLTMKLAAPIAISQLGQMFMGIVDTLMVGKLGPEFIGAVGLGNSIFWICALPCTGLLMGLDYLISYNFGRKQIAKCNFWLSQGVYFALICSVASAIIIYFLSTQLSRFGFDPELVINARAFLSSYCWSIIPLAVFIAFRQYAQSMKRARFITLIMFLANALNAFLNWIFIYGHGTTAMGVAGSGVATFLTRSVMLFILIAYTFSLDQKLNLNLLHTGWRLDLSGIKDLLKLGVPAATQSALEVGVFSLSTGLAGKVGVIALAAHALVLNIASFTFMVPLGISSAAAILVGHASGEEDFHQARVAGYTSFLIGVGFMFFSALTLYIYARPLLLIFTKDAAVIEVGKRLLLFAAFFQVADGVQVVGTGALRGLGETRLPMLANLVGHWVIGLPVGIYLCFYTHQGIVGLWGGLTLGLICVAIAVFFSWVRRSSVARHPF